MNRSHLPLASLLLLVPLAGCPATPSKNDGGGLRDFRVVFDLVPASDDLTVSAPDLTVPPSNDDGGVAQDLTASSDDSASSANCTQLNSWPTVQSAAGFDSTNSVTYALEADSATAPYNLLSVEDWQSLGETYPKVVTFDSTVTYNSTNACEVCGLIAACTSTGCADKFLAQAGTMTVTRADRNASAGRMIATGTNLKLVEWDFNADQPVASGQCYLLATASFDVTWAPAPTDAGVPADLKGADLKLASDMTVSNIDLKGQSNNLSSGSADLSTLACNPVINELQVAGSGGAGDEFIEIFNPCTASVNLGGWKLRLPLGGQQQGRCGHAGLLVHPDDQRRRLPAHHRQQLHRHAHQRRLARLQRPGGGRRRAGPAQLGRRDRRQRLLRHPDGHQRLHRGHAGRQPADGQVPRPHPQRPRQQRQQQRLPASHAHAQEDELTDDSPRGGIRTRAPCGQGF